MPSDLHARARRILRLLYEKSPDRWDALIHDQCGEDTELRDLVLGLIRTAPQTADKLLPDTEFRPGSSLGDYQLVRRLGPGTMGEVWLAWEERLGRLVCLKFLPATFRKDADRVARFNREAHALAKINHPNIVTLHGRKKIDGVDFLEMEFVVGEPLGTLRKITGRSQYERAIWIARQLIDAMSAAHGMGVLHRDLKPHNVLICDTDHVVVLDFGVTRYEGG